MSVCPSCGGVVEIITHYADGNTYSRSPGALTVILLSIITGGVYFVWWLIKAIGGKYDRTTDAQWITLAVCQSCGKTWRTARGKV